MDKKSLKVLEYHKILERLSDCAVTDAVKERALCLLPSSDIGEVTRSLSETDEAFTYMVKKGAPPISPVGDVRASLKRAEVGAVLSMKELLSISHVLRISRQLKAYFDERDFKTDYPILSALDEGIVTNRSLETRISDCILSEDEMADDASAELSTIRKRMAGMSNKIRDVLNDMIRSNKYRSALQESIITMRDDRYVLPVKAEQRSAVPGIVHDASASGATLFVEPMAVVQINNEMRELAAKEKEEIERILAELSGLCAEESEVTSADYDRLLDVDFAFSKAKLSHAMNGVMPKVNDEGKINIKKGRHPLIDARKVVPVDVYLGDAFDTLVITGPNTGGKTVTLKTLGLFSLMCQTGLHIPAASGSVMAVFENVFADIGDEQSIEQSLSTFSSHMVNIVNILDKADDKSLVLFDELGAGTDPTEGAALAVSILEYVKMCGAKTAATTHYSEIKLYALSTERVENAACEFDVATLAPTYKLLIGVPGKSNAFAIAQKLGIGDYIINRAKEQMTAENVRFEDLVTDLERNRAEAESARLEAESLRREAEIAKTHAASDKKQIEKQKQRLLDEARREAKAIVERARKETNELLAQVQKAAKEENATGARDKIESARRELSKKSGLLDEGLSDAFAKPSGYKPPKSLRLGQTVDIMTLGQRGTVLTMPDKNGNLQVQAGILKVSTNIKSLRAVEEDTQKEVKKYQKAASGRINKTMSATTELDLRGKMADEARILVERFIDDAIMARLEQVTIIHGKGTGALRAAVHEELKSTKGVKSFRLGAYGEGDAGVTIVTF